MGKQRFHQAGMSSVGILVVIGISAFFLLCCFKLIPHYIDSYFVEASLNKVSEEGLEGMNNGQIREKISKHFTIDGVRDISVRDVEIERDKDRVVLVLDYEKRFEFIGNAEVVLVFNHRIDSSDR